MTSDAEWDVNKYWSPHEVPLFWEVKKKFLLSNKDKLPEDRLICMAQVYYNVKAMGCRYVEGKYCSVPPSMCTIFNVLIMVLDIRSTSWMKWINWRKALTMILVNG
ncbi:hypothetical protein AAG570_010939 [Ranatra chinensis]|uniref:XRN2-binding (XTBD) domain-containing protein n=1 Tax=Ranatra chinensis TaxID=642074 RepID=A0ABD0YJ58_9HEMI